jgi:hypothetical protein
MAYPLLGSQLNDSARQYARENGKSYPWLRLRILIASFGISYNTLARRGTNRLMLIFGLRKVHVRNDVMSVADAVDSLSSILKQMNMNLRGILNRENH